MIPEPLHTWDRSESHQQNEPGRQSMSQRCRHLTFASMIALLCFAGCADQWRPPVENVSAEHSDTAPQLSRCLQADRLYLRVYQRQEMPNQKDRATTAYARCTKATRMLEGNLLARAFLPIKRYFQDAAVPTTQPAEQKPPKAPLKGGWAILFEVVEPLEPIPVDLETSKPLVVITGPGPGSGKLATCLSQLYHEHQRGFDAGYAKFETFPIWTCRSSIR